MTKPKSKDPREHAVMVRLSDRERAAVEREAAREPLASFCRRIVMDYCERQQKARKRKGGA